MTGTDLQLVSLGRFPGRVALTWHENSLYASHRYSLWRWTPPGGSWEFVARYPADWTRAVSSAIRLGSRLRRDGFHALSVLPDGGLVATLPKAIALCAPGGREFRVSWRIRRGTRPLTLATTPGGAIFWGEYFSNAERDEVHVYGSRDGGRTWDVVYTFAAGTIRHVHSITYDPYRDHLWVCTGDYEAECRILRASTDWSTVEPLLNAGQQTRAVRPVVAPQGLFFATDSELEQNYIYCVAPDGGVERLCPTAGPSIWACQVGSALFFSTNVEPSKVHRGRSACVYGSRDGSAWSRLLAWRKDPWHMTLFQFGNIILPRGRNDTHFLAATGMAVEKEDGVMHVWALSPAA
jgi:hypothetical protein